MGVLVPWANSVVESELPRWGSGGVIWHYARLVPAHQGTALDEDFLSGLVEAAPSALHQLSRLPLARVYLACTSAAFTRPERLTELTEGYPVPVISAFDAIVAQLRAHRAQKIALATPYPQQITDAEVAQFEKRGIPVTGAVSLGLTDGYADLTTHDLAALTNRLEQTALQRADMVVLSCTGWPTQAAIAVLRRRLDRPVISSNTAIAMHALPEHR